MGRSRRARLAARLERAAVEERRLAVLRSCQRARRGRRERPVPIRIPRSEEELVLHSCQPELLAELVVLVELVPNILRQVARQGRLERQGLVEHHRSCPLVEVEEERRNRPR